MPINVYADPRADNADRADDADPRVRARIRVRPILKVAKKRIKTRTRIRARGSARMPTMIITYEIAFNAKRSNDCKSCSRDHMCKGDVVQKLMEKHADSIFYYFGDGENDHCPMKIIGEKSVNKCFCRRGFSLEQALITSPLPHVTLYSDASEILNKISS